MLKMATPQLSHNIVIGDNTYVYHPNNDILIFPKYQDGLIYVMYEVNLKTGETYATNVGPEKYKISSGNPHIDKLRSICAQLDKIVV